MKFLVRIRLAILVMLVLGMLAIAPAIAQKLGPDGAPNPTASVTSQRDLLKQVPRIEGRIDIPDTKAAVLIQPAGRTWDYFHEVLLHRGGAIVIVGTVVFLGLAYLIMGRIRISAGRSGVKILRFKAFERFSHWLTAVSFVILGLTGLNITFGKIAAFAAGRSQHVLGYFAGRQVRPQFHQLLFRGRPCPDHRDLLQGQSSGESRHRLGQAGRWLHQEQACPCRPLQSR